jgi:hypothetical protein
MKDYAIEEWFDYYKPVNGIKRRFISPILNCFCKAQMKIVGRADLAFTLYTSSAGQQAEICANWMYDGATGKVYNLAVSIMINVINFVIRMILIGLITNIA